MRMLTEGSKNKVKRGKSEASGYKSGIEVMEMPLTHRICHFLNWAAENQALQVYNYRSVAKAIRNGHNPSGQEVKMVVGAITRCRKPMAEFYNRGILSFRGLGIRASVDDADMLRNGQQKPLARFHSVVKSLEQTAALIDTSNVPKTPENKPFMDQFKKGYEPALLQMKAWSDRLKALAPVPEPDKK